MKEVAFINQNKDKWMSFEQALSESRNISPEQMADSYIHLLNDLSFSQTYYPKSKTTDYLNYLVSQIYFKIYKTKRIEQNRISSFFKTEVPEIMYRRRKILWFAIFTFLFFVILGVISARYDDRFVRLILGDGYVNMTIENIEKGDPMAVYKSDSQLGSFIGITCNNVLVAVRSYLFGIFVGVITFYIALSNAIMLGSFQYFFYEHGVLADSIKGIWLHGAMEIFSIVVATAAGYMLAVSWLFPKTYSRLASFKKGFKESLCILLSIVPFFIVAGFIEGFVTRYSNKMPFWLDILIILGTFLFISYYYLIYPFIVHKKVKYE